jgi:hypothetical protein
MNLEEIVIRVLIALPFIDFPVACYLGWAAHTSAGETRIQLLYDRARAAVIGTLASEAGALVALLYVQGIAVPPEWGLVLLLGALTLPGLIPLFFLLDLALGSYREED